MSSRIEGDSSSAVDLHEIAMREEAKRTTQAEPTKVTEPKEDQAVRDEQHHQEALKAGERWSSYADQDKNRVPPSVEANAQEARAQDRKQEDAAEELRRRSIADLQNELKLKEGRFRG